MFLSLIDKHFPKGHKCFNRNTAKATYCTLSNVMDNHNAKVLSKESEPKIDIVNGVPKMCCEDQVKCPTMPDRCDQTNVI